MIKTSKPKKPPLVEVDWIDARDQTESFALADIAERVKLIHRTTCGYLVFQDKERTILAKDWDPNEDPPEAGNFTCIPTGWVQKVRARRRARKPETKVDEAATE